MQRLNVSGVEFLQFDLFPKKTLRHASFLKHGGHSQTPFASLNFSTRAGDCAQKVSLNLQKAQTVLGISCLSRLEQCHSAHVVEASPSLLQRADGMSTQQLGLGLMILHADCQAAIFYDPIHRAIAAVHCGWRGNVGNIYQNTVLHMHKSYGTQPQDLRVGISPSLGPEACEFINYKTELPPEFLPFKFKTCHFNLWEISRWQLLQAGVLDHHIEFSGMCTYTHTADCYSYRRSKLCGHHATFVMLSLD
ncbi:MAG: laccase domain-containing protein [Verrucomicrobia bacterium]|nr:laccase domain-containing protein [Verrucomicrobiota bacterium]MBS0646271.1 laccase domain-containing protein [Verrucomicrobiota bacterium]